MFTEEEKVQIVNKAIEAAGQALYMASECTGAKNFIDGTMTFDDGKEHWQLQFYKLQPGVFEQMKLSSLKQLDLHHKAQLQQPDVSGSLPLDELFEKLQSMRLDKSDMEAMGQLQSYGYTDCINDLLEWVHSKRQ